MTERYTIKHQCPSCKLVQYWFWEPTPNEICVDCKLENALKDPEHVDPLTKLILRNKSLKF